MNFGFDYEWQAIEFAADCANNGIVVIRDKELVRIPYTKIPQACELLKAACNS